MNADDKALEGLAEQDAKRFVLVLAPVSPWPKIDPVQRLRAALKRLKRDYGLRCVECKPVEGG